MSINEIPKVEEIPEEIPEEKVKKVRAKRPLSAYNIFVKENMGHADVVCLPSKERMKKISGMWKESKAKVDM